MLEIGQFDGSILGSAPRELTLKLVREHIAQNGGEREKILHDPEAFGQRAARIFQLMKPFNDYLNCALASFEMPTR